jgi:hypothetical protein
MCLPTLVKSLVATYSVNHLLWEPFDVSPLPAVTRHDWDLLILIRFLLRLMTSQTSGAGQEAAKLGRGPRNKKVKKLSHAIAYAEITILTHSSCCMGLAI